MKNKTLLGVMIDCSRDAVPNVAGLKRFFEIISKMGYNVAMLYTEDTYEVENEPYFGYKRGRYSADELKELDAYAASVGIELVPFVQTLAHLGHLKRWRAYRHKVFDIDDILLVDDEKTYALIDNMFASLEKEFTSRRVHLGMDEAHHIGLGKYLDTHGYTDRYALLMKHLRRVCDIAKAHGFEKMMMANDLFFNMSPGEFCSDTERNFPKEIKDNIPEGLELVHWDYFGTKVERYEAMLHSTKKLTGDVWFSGGAFTWNTFSPHNRYSIARNEIAVPACKKCGVDRAFFTLWGDDGGECAYQTALPAMMHAASLWRGLDESEMKAEFSRITGEDFDDFCDMDLPNYIYGRDIAVESPYFQHSPSNHCKTHLYDDVFHGVMSANLGEVDANTIASHAKRLHALAAKGGEFAVHYETLALLCDAMEIKLPLARKTRAVYEKRERAALLALADEYGECIGRVEAFYASFRRRWYEINKTYGFEIHAARLGGLIRRLDDCRLRLVGYAKGEIEEIPELNEPILPFDDTYVTSWEEMISAN